MPSCPSPVGSSRNNLYGQPAWTSAPRLVSSEPGSFNVFLLAVHAAILCFASVNSGTIYAVEP